MAQEIADSTLLDTWASSGLIVEPDISKIIEGWQLGEQPPHEYMNWLQNTFGSKLNHILKNGVVKWNNETEYLVGSSVQHNGNVWLCETANTNSEPSDVNSNWGKLSTNLYVDTKVDKVSSTDKAIVRFNGTTGEVQNSSIGVDDTGNIGSGTQSFNGFGGSGFKNLIINGSKQVNLSGLTDTNNAYNYDNHYKVGNNWFVFIDGKSIASGEPYTLSWVGSASASYYIGTAGASTINAQTFTPIVKGETITPTISSSQILWIKFASNASGSTYNKVQLEPGTVTTPYEQKLYEIEEDLIQSCYEIGVARVDTYGVSTQACGHSLQYAKRKRNIPNVTITYRAGAINVNGNTSTTRTKESLMVTDSALATGKVAFIYDWIADARPY